MSKNRGVPARSLIKRESIVRIAESVQLQCASAEQAAWGRLAGSLAEAIMVRALQMPTQELRRFIATTEEGARIADAHDASLRAAAVVARLALL